MKNCECYLNLDKAYEISLVQSDYASILYTITNDNDEAIENIETVIFSSKKLKVEKTLEKLNDTEWLLSFTGDETTQFKTFSGMTYDLTITMKGETTPVTIVYEASIVVKKKENALNADNSGDVQS